MNNTLTEGVKLKTFGVTTGCGRVQLVAELNGLITCTAKREKVSSMCGLLIRTTFILTVFEPFVVLHRITSFLLAPL